MTYVRKGLQFANVQTIMGDHERSHTSISVSDQQYLLDMKGLWSAKLEAPEP